MAERGCGLLALQPAQRLQELEPFGAKPCETAAHAKGRRAAQPWQEVPA